MWGVIGVAIMVVPQYANMLRIQLRNSRMEDAGGGGGFGGGGAAMGANRPDGDVKTLDVPGDCRFAYEPPDVSDNSEKNPNMAWPPNMAMHGLPSDDRRGCPSQTAYG